MASVDHYFKDVLPNTQPVFDLLTSRQMTTTMIELRDATFTGFAALEVEKGFVKPSVNFSTSHGQEMFKIMLFRVIEECAESIQGNDETHRKEEAIDALNYLLSAIMLDRDLFPVDTIAGYLFEAAYKTFVSYPHFMLNRPLEISDLGLISYKIGAELADTFRNRAWMSNPQAIYFEGMDTVEKTFNLICVRLMQCFSTWQEFQMYYLAKDAVLQFRLKTKY